MTTAKNERYFKVETNGNLPAELLEQLQGLVYRLVTDHPEFFDSEPREQTYGIVLARAGGRKRRKTPQGGRR